MQIWTAFLVVILALAFSIAVIRNRIKVMFYVQHMEREERVSRMHVERIIDALDIRPDQKIADVGSGSGLFTRAIASRLSSDGRVYAVDVNRHLLKHIRKVADEISTGNIVTVLATGDDPGIPEQVDLVFMCDTLHHTNDQPGYIKKLVSHLKKMGKAAIIDFNTNWPPMSRKFTEEDLIGWMSSASMNLIKRHDFIKDEFFMIFRRQ